MSYYEVLERVSKRLREDERQYLAKHDQARCRAGNTNPDDPGEKWFCLFTPDHPGRHVDARGHRWSQQVEEPGMNWESPQAKAEKEMDIAYVSDLIRQGNWPKVRKWIEIRLGPFGDEAELEQLRKGMRGLGFTVGRNPEGVDDTVAATLLIVRELKERLDAQPKRWDDEGPRPDGTRTAAQWLAAMGEDAAIIREKVREVIMMDDPEEVSKTLALALKEAQRLQRDIYRYGEEAYGIARDAIDRARSGL